MLCVSINASSLEAMREVIREVDRAAVSTQRATGAPPCVELRMDLTLNALHAASQATPSTADIAHVVREAAGRVPKIATCRDLDPERGFSERRRRVLEAMIEAGAEFVDVEIEAPAEYKRKVIECAKKQTKAGQKCTVVVSYHNYEVTPNAAELAKLVDECYACGGEVAKVAVAVHSERDAARVLALYDTDRPIVALGMGEAGKITRLASLRLGAPFSFVALAEASRTAPGQLLFSEATSVLASFPLIRDQGAAGEHSDGADASKRQRQ